MFKLRTLLPGLALSAAVLTSPTQAQDVSPTTPVAFDFYLLSLSVGPSFCALSPRNRSKDECSSLTAASFQQTPLTVHGLWPSRIGASVNRQPQYCARPGFAIPPAVAGALQHDMPGGRGLERHEWQRHGSCSGLSPQDYFAAIVRLDTQMNDAIGPFIRDAAGKTLRIQELLNAVAAQQPNLAPAIVVDCRTPKGGGPAVVAEIRVVLSKDFTPRPARSVLLGQNSGCPGGAGRIPAPGG